MKNPRGEGITVNQQSANDPSGSVLSVPLWQIPQSANDSPVLCALCVSAANPAFCHRFLRLCALCVSVANPAFCQRSLRLCALCVSVANPSFCQRSLRLCALCVSVANPSFCQRSLRLCALCVSVANPAFCQRSLRLCALCVSVANPAFSSVRLAAIAYHWLHVLRPRGVPCSWPQPQPQQHPTQPPSGRPGRAAFPGSALLSWPAAIPRARFRVGRANTATSSSTAS